MTHVKIVDILGQHMEKERWSIRLCLSFARLCSNKETQWSTPERD